MDLIKKRIQELCPDVMELKFGCEFRFKNSNTPCVVLNSPAWKSFKFLYAPPLLQPSFASLPRKNIEDDIEILGSPLTLAVVLRAIMRVKMSYNANFKPVPGGVTVPFLDAENLAYYWDLLHDSYDQQSEECKQLIGTLLGITTN